MYNPPISRPDFSGPYSIWTGNLLNANSISPALVNCQSRRCIIGLAWLVAGIKRGNRVCRVIVCLIKWLVVHCGRQLGEFMRLIMNYENINSSYLPLCFIIARFLTLSLAAVAAAVVVVIVTSFLFLGIWYLGLVQRCAIKSTRKATALIGISN